MFLSVTLTPKKRCNHHSSFDPTLPLCAPLVMCHLFAGFYATYGQSNGLLQLWGQWVYTTASGNTPYVRRIHRTNGQVQPISPKGEWVYGMDVSPTGHVYVGYHIWGSRNSGVSKPSE